jgi:hypothetical protein
MMHLGSQSSIAHGQFVGGEAAEDDRVDRAQPRAGQHRLQRLGHHRHVDDDAVALLDALGLQRPGERGDAVLQFLVGDLVGRAGQRAVVDDRDPLAMAGLHVAVDRVPAAVQLAVREPFVERRVVVEREAPSRRVSSQSIAH